MAAADPLLAAFDAAAPDPVVAAFDAHQHPDPVVAAFDAHGRAPRAPGDVISQIEARKAHPPATAHGDPNVPKSTGPLDVLSKAYDALGGGTLTEGGDTPGSNPLDIVQGAADAASSSSDYARQAREAKTLAAARGKALGVVPMVGPLLSAVAQPSVAVAENRPVTREENLAAMGSGAALTGMLAPHLIGKAMGGAKGIKAVEPPPVADTAPQPTPTDPATARSVAEQPAGPIDPQMRASFTDKLWDAIQTAPKADLEVKLPTPVYDALKSGQIASKADLAAVLDRNFGAVQARTAPEAPTQAPVPDNVVPMTPRSASPAPEPAGEDVSPHEAELHANIANGMDVKEALGRYQAADEKASGFNPESEIKDARPFTGKSLAAMTDDELHSEAGRLAGLADRATKNGDHVTAKGFEDAFDKTADEANRRAAIAPTTDEPQPTEHVDQMRLAPTFDEVRAAAKKLPFVDEIASGINPAGASEGAASAADLLRKSKGEIANDATIERAKFSPASKLNETVRNIIGKPLSEERMVGSRFARASDADNIASISNYERTGKFGGTVPDSYSAMYKATTDAAHKTLQEVYGDDRVGYVENYVRRAFKFGSKADEAKATGVLSNWTGSLSASTAPLKGRVLNVPLDGALQAMRDAGLNVKMATTNPELLRQWTVENANQARVYKQAWTDANQGKLIQYVERGNRVPDGLVGLDDRVSEVFSRGRAIQMGRQTWERSAQIDRLSQLKELHGQQRTTAKSLADTSKLFDRTDKAFSETIGAASKRLADAQNSADALYEKARTMASDQSLRSDITPILDRGIATERRIEALSSKLSDLSRGDLASKRTEIAATGNALLNEISARSQNIADLGREVDAGPNIKEPVKVGKYFAEPGVARVFNNAISKGLGDSPTFRGIRAINNAYNQVQLGLSAFHLTGTAINAGISDLSNGIQQLLQGDVAGAAKSVGRSVVPGLSFVRDAYNGHQFIADLVRDDPAARAVLADKLNPAGGRLGIEAAYRNAAYDNMVNAWMNRRFHAAIGNFPLAMIQKIASPLMEYAIPRVKLGAFMDLADTMRKGLGDSASPTDVQRAYEKAWDSIDNRFGQLVHDNLFWNRTAADLAQVGTRSVGWNLGTVREIGGGVLDLSRSDIKSPRTAYAFALPVYAGAIGAAYMYLHTGKGPQELKDYYYPKNGLKDNKGRDDRVALPTYMKDVHGYATDPVGTLEHKASPLLSLAFDLGTNRDYFGDMIRNPDDTKSKQLLQDGAYALKQLRPFSIQQAQNTGAKPQAVEQFFGFTKAASAIKSSDAQNDAARERRRVMNDAKMQKAAIRHGK